MGLFDYTSNFGFGTPAALGGSMFGNNPDLFAVKPPTQTTPQTPTATRTASGSGATSGGNTASAPRAASLNLWPSSAPTPAPRPSGMSGPSPTQDTGGTASMLGGVSKQSSYTGPSFNYSYSNVGPTMAPMPSMDFSGLLEGFGNLLSKDQQGDVGQPTMPVQKDTMALQALRESAAGWQDNVTGPTSNQALGQRIPPDESKKLAALGSARIY